MFCTNCGNPLAEGQAFCNKCGAPTEAPAPVAEQPVAPAEATAVPPVAEPMVTPEVAFVPPMPVSYAPPQPKVKKQAFLTKVAPGNVRTCAWLSWIAAVAAIALLVGGWFSFLNTSVEDIPVIAMVAGDSVDELEDAKDELKNAVDELEEKVEDAKDELNDDEIEALESFIDAGKKLSDDISVKNIVNIVAEANEFAEVEINGHEMSELDEMKDSLEMFEEISTVLNVLQLLPLIILLGFALFTLFGGLFRVRGLVITGMIFTTLFALPFMSALFVIGNLALHIALIVFTSITTSAWKKYRQAI